MLGWDSYLVDIEGQVASVFLNLDSPSPDVRAGLPCLTYVTVALASPGAHGLTTDAEFQALVRLDDVLERTVNGLGCLYVGRYTHAGQRTFFVYTPSCSIELDELVTATKDCGYEPDISFETDADWTRYDHWMYPTPDDLRGIHDRRFVEHLRAKGDVLEEPREVEHWIYFRSPEHRADFRSKALGEGYEIRSERLAEDHERPFVLRIFRTQPVEESSIVPAVRQLFLWASALDAEYDGWETKFVKAQS